MNNRLNYGKKNYKFHDYITRHTSSSYSSSPPPKCQISLSIPTKATSGADS